MNNLSTFDSLESCTTHLTKGVYRPLAVLVLLLLTISAFAQPPISDGDCGRNVLNFEAGYLSTTIDDFPISSQGSGTWEAWVKKANWGSGSQEFTIFSNAYAYPSEKTFYVSLHPVVGLHFRSGYTDGGYAAYPTTMQYTTDSWHHLAATWSEDGSYVTIAIYVDGDSITSTQTTSKFGIEPTLYFGGSPTHAAFAPGSMAEIRIWDVARTEAEISSSMNSTLIGNETGLIGYWPLNDATESTTATNLVASGSAATLVSMTPSSAWVATYPFGVSSGAEVKSGSTIDFETQMTNESSEVKVFTVTNNGATTLDFTESPISQMAGTDADQFILDLTGTTGSLAAGASTTLSVSFHPTSEGVKTAFFSLTNVESCEDPYTIYLSGIGSTLDGSVSVDANVSIYGGSDGQLTVSPSGGTAPYAYLWSNGATTGTATGLSIGEHSVIVTDDVGASVMRSASITQPDELSITLTVDAHVSTVGGNDGAITASVTGGVEPYSYLWNNDETTASISSLIAGEYELTVTDANGATSLGSVIVTQPKPFEANIQVVTEVSGGGSYGELSAFGLYGEEPYTYLWSNGADSQVISNLTAGTYSVIITDDEGKEEEASIVLGEGITRLTYTGAFYESGDNTGSVIGSAKISLLGGRFSSDDLGTSEVSISLPSGLTSTLTVEENSLIAQDWTSLELKGDLSYQTWAVSTFGNGLFVVLANSYETSVMSSADGVNWVVGDLEHQDWSSVAYGNGRYVAVTTDGYASYSENGINWSSPAFLEDSDWKDVAFGNGLFVVIASYYDDYAVMVSEDGENWTVPGTLINDYWVSITYGGGQFLAVSEYGNVMVSSDGQDWLLYTDAMESSSVNGLAYGNGKYVVCSDDSGEELYGKIWSSTNGVNWTEQSISVSRDWELVTYGGGNFIVTGDGFNDGISMISSDGENWSTFDNGVYEVRTLNYGNGIFVGFGEHVDSDDDVFVSSTSSVATLTLSGNASSHQSSGNISDIVFDFTDAAFANMAASDVTNAANYPSGIGIDFLDNPSIIYSGDGFSEAAGSDGSVTGSIMILLTGDNFKDDDEDDKLELDNEVYLGNIPDGLSATFSIIEQNTQGEDWVDATDESITGTWSITAYGDGTYVAIDNESTSFVYSTDGMNWTEGELDYNGWWDMTYANGLFVAVGAADDEYGYVMTSTNGIDWNYQAVEGYWEGVIYGAGLFVVVGDDEAMTSPDGENWTALGEIPNTEWYSVAYGNGKFVAVSPYGYYLMTSEDGINWSEIPDAEYGFEDVVFGNGLFVAMGEDYVQMSEDGVVWTHQSIDYGNWRSIIYGDGQFLIVGEGDNSESPSILRSRNGIDWTGVESVAGIVLKDAIYANGTFYGFTSDNDSWLIQSVESTGLAELILSGNASEHQNTNDLSDITFDFSNDAFVNTEATYVLNATGPASSGLGIDFHDNPANDNCANAAILPLYQIGVGIPTHGTTLNAEYFGGTVPCDESSQINDVWYSFNSGPWGLLILKSELGTAGFLAGALYESCGSEVYMMPFALEGGELYPACIPDVGGELYLELSPNTDYLIQAWNSPSDAGTFSIILETNLPPTVSQIDDIEMDELTELNLTVEATDDFIPLEALEYYLDDESEGLGMSIDLQTGALTWTPTENQEGVYSVTVWAIDYYDEESGQVSSDSVTFSITVNEVNLAPSIEEISDQVVEITGLSLQVVATDTDLPAQALTYSLDQTSLDMGISITEDGGLISWVPQLNAYGSSNMATVTVSDGVVSSSETFTLTVNKAEQAITFEALSDKTYGDAAFDLTATASSDLEVTYASSDETVASVSGSTVTIVGAGTATITASQAGNDNYSAALDVTQSLTIEKASQAITFEALANKTYGDAAFDLTGTGGASGNAVTFTSSDETVASISGSTVTILGVGTATITASQAGNDNFGEALDVTQSLTIEKASQAITFEALADKTYGDAAFDLTATGGASGHAVTFTSSDETVASVSGSTVTIVGAGTVTITASQAGNDNYSAALDVQQTLTIEKASQAITFEALTDKTFGDAPFDLTATGGSSGHAVTFTSSDETVASVSGSTVTIEGAGTATITASQAGNDNYSAALDVSQSLTIEKASQAITFEALTDKTYGDAAFDLTATGGSSGHAVTFTSSDETVASVSGSTVTIVGAGTATITASQAGNDNYSAALDVQQTLTIEKASQAITFAALADKTYGDADFDLTATGGASGHEVTFTSSDETVASISGSTVTIVGAGTATITASQAGNDNYSAALDVQQTLTIEKASQAITFAALADKTYGDADFDLTATGGASGHEVTFTSSDETVASVSGSTVTIVGAGTATITASQAGNDNYSAVDVSQSLMIGQASLMVSAGDEFRVYGEVNPGFTIAYQGFIGDDSEADLETVPTASTLATQTSDVGTYAITVSGGVAQNYAFTYTDGTLTINKAQAKVTLENLTQTADGTAKSPTVTTNPAALNYSMTFDGSSTLPTQAGTYVVEVTLLETNYEGSATGNFVLTKAVALGTLPLVNEVKVYPNPAAERLTVSGDDGLLVKIYDISGVLLLEDEINQTIAIDRLRAGVYLLQVSDANGRVVSHQRVVKY